jgi:suppressor for copper-sensitivity B
VHPNFLVATAIAWLAAAQPAAAQATAWQDLEHAKARLIAATTAVGTAGEVWLGLEIKLDPEFKTYWRSPGDAGVPPELDWSASRNVAGLTIAWPTPKRYVLAGFHTFGYADEVVLPLQVALARPGEPVAIRLELAIGICRDICVLGEASFRLDLPAGVAAPSPHAAAIARYRARVPGPPQGIAIAASVADRSGEVVLTVDAIRSDGPAFGAIDVIVEGLDGVAMPPPAIERRSARDVAAVYRWPAKDATAVTPGRTVVVTLIEAGRGVEQRVTLGAR